MRARMNWAEFLSNMGKKSSDEIFSVCVKQGKNALVGAAIKNSVTEIPHGVVQLHLTQDEPGQEVLLVIVMDEQDQLLTREKFCEKYVGAEWYVQTVREITDENQL